MSQIISLFPSYIATISAVCARQPLNRVYTIFELIVFVKQKQARGLEFSKKIINPRSDNKAIKLVLYCHLLGKKR